MKKLKNSLRIYSLTIIILIFSSLCNGSLFAKELEIETSKGIIEIELPEDQSVEESFKEMAVLYLEERWDHEDLLKETELLLQEIKDYQSSVKQVQDLYEETLISYEELKKLYEKETRPDFLSPVLAFSLTIPFEYTFTGSVSFGILLMEKFQVNTIISYPLGLGLSLGLVL
jgi:hypothetical protein